MDDHYLLHLIVDGFPYRFSILHICFDFIETWKFNSEQLTLI